MRKSAESDLKKVPENAVPILLKCCVSINQGVLVLFDLPDSFRQDSWDKSRNYKGVIHFVNSLKKCARNRKKHLNVNAVKKYFLYI